MNKLDKQYTDLLQDILDNGFTKQDRTGTGTISLFGRQIRHNMKDGFPLLTTKKMPFKTIVTELLWFLRGDTNIKFLVDNNCHIWDGDVYKRYENSYAAWVVNSSWSNNAEPWDMENFIRLIKEDERFCSIFGELGPIYGKQWRKWVGYEQNTKIDGVYSEYAIDQIANLINNLKTNPDSRRLMVNAWNVGELDQMVLPPCHYGFQVYTRELSLEERIEISTFWYKDEVKKSLEDSTTGTTEKYVLDKLEKQNIPTRAISLMWNQRSVDTFLGLPFNIASYGLLLEILAKEVNMVPDELIGNLGDVHLYSNHIEQAKEQIGRYYTIEERVALIPEGVLSQELIEYFSLNKRTNSEINVALAKYNISPSLHTRQPFPLPKLIFNPIFLANLEHKGFNEAINGEINFQVENYQSHPAIKAPLSN
jgi:thymidylate synthase